MTRSWKGTTAFGLRIFPLWTTVAILSAGVISAGVAHLRTLQQESTRPAITVIVDQVPLVDGVIGQVSHLEEITEVLLPSPAVSVVNPTLSDLLGDVNQRTLRLGVSPGLEAEALVDLALKIRSWPEVEEVGVDPGQWAQLLQRWRLMEAAGPAGLLLLWLVLVTIVAHGTSLSLKETWQRRSLERLLGASAGAEFLPFTVLGFGPLAVVWTVVWIAWAFLPWSVEFVPGRIGFLVWWALGGLSLMGGGMIGFLAGKRWW